MYGVFFLNLKQFYDEFLWIFGPSPFITKSWLVYGPSGKRLNETGKEKEEEEVTFSGKCFFIKGKRKLVEKLLFLS